MAMVSQSVRSHEHRASSLNSSGLTLIELLVTLVILSVLAGVALPYAELVVRRDKETELRLALREVRTAIDRFHDDWINGNLSKTGDGVSEDGFPKTLAVLVDGADAGDAKGTKRRYLRRVPRDPFADPAKAPENHWSLRAYQDDPQSFSWSGKDVFDVRTLHDGEALNGTKYKDW
jgi:general secretion pathway protein G